MLRSSIRITAILCAFAAVSGAGHRAALTAQAQDPCGPATYHAIACENSKPGTPPREWDVNGRGSSNIQGYATEISVNKGETVHFKISTTHAAYTLHIYRIGYYGGNGARKIATVLPSASLPQQQPSCIKDPLTGLLDCGNWAVSASWDVPSDAVSGVYIAKVVSETRSASHIIFIVRDDERRSDILFQTSDTTWQAYNFFGGNSFYQGNPAGRAYRLSYNRPFYTREDYPESWFFNAEYPMVRWLERNGYDVSYSTGVDTARRGAELLEHEVFMSVGQDEYWSADQRANVEAARDAGVHLAFFSGNSVFWKTRWENSIAGASTPYRTLVSYKETHANAKIDPSPEWTGTWRDPRFSPPGDGGRPENALTGTLFMVNDPCDAPLQVPAADGRMRFWRNTSVADLAPGETATMTASTVGYECDEDIDNGFRPAGLMRLSTTTMTVTQRLADHGSGYGPGVATHSATLYRAPSGALVFGAGTVQWSWGLDGTHDRAVSIPDPRMQQATVNLLADMGVQPATLEAGLVPATETTDLVAPEAAIASPAPGAATTIGDPVTISGTAADFGGVVGAVEVSVNGGATWHPAAGRESWTYSWLPTADGPVTIMARAADDSGNLQPIPAQITVNVGARACPCSIWSSASAPTVAASPDGSAVELGIKFRVDEPGTITALRFYKSAENTGTHTGSLWAADGTRLATATFTNETASGWQQVVLTNPVAVLPGTTYVASYFAPNGHYAFDEGYFLNQGVDNPPLRALGGGLTQNGVYKYGGGFPVQSYHTANYWVDVVFVPGSVSDEVPPVVLSTTPQAGKSGVSLPATISATFSEALHASTVTSSTFLLRTAANDEVAAAVAFDPATRVATLAPAAPLAMATTYTATVKGGGSGVKDLAGNALAADYTWSFTTAGPTSCPCTIWSSSARPTLESAPDSGAVEVGVKFQSDVAGSITALRFYKGVLNSGTHVVKLWTATGTLLASATAMNETASGWQQVKLSSPVAIEPNTTYIASYFAPNGHYSFDTGYFLNGGVNRPPLDALGNATSPNGVYRYGGGFPTQTYNGSNYWVDVVFTTQALQSDVTPPAVSSVSPADGATAVNVGTNVTATFSEPMDEATIGSSTVTLRSPAGDPAPAAVTYDALNRIVTLNPSASLSGETTYTVSILGGIGGVKDRAGNPLASDRTWSFTTTTPAECPCTIWSPSDVPAVVDAPDTRAVELGVKFQADTPGFITGIRFYKSQANTGTHVGHLWTADGTPLGDVTFAGETSSGWQEATFATPIPIEADVTYIASYLTTTGHYAFDVAYFTGGGVENAPLRALAGAESPNGVYKYGGGFPTDSWFGSNYWVDVVFVRAADTTPPVVTSTAPAAGAAGVVLDPTVRALFNEPLDPATVSNATAELRSAAGAIVASTVAYDAGSRAIVLQPSATLIPATTYVATIEGGIGGVKDVAGNPMASDVVWSFTTRSGSGCPCSLWTTAVTPPMPEVGDASAVELGMKFQALVEGVVVGMRFYKGPNNTGTHVGRLWTSTGALLASVTFTGETASGWQQAYFGSPVTIAPNTTYVISYHAPNGHYAFTQNYFVAEVRNPPLVAVANATSPNGVYRYGSGFPTGSYVASNYWVDVLFTPTGPGDVTAPAVVSTTPGSSAGGVNAAMDLAVRFSESMDPATLTPATIQLRDASDNLVPTAVVYDDVTRTAFVDVPVLVSSATYVATVAGGAGGVTDESGNPLATDHVWSFTTAPAPAAEPQEGPGGPVVVITSSANPMGRYYGEILRAEGLNAFRVVDISQTTADELASYRVAILAEMALDAGKASMLAAWVQAGGTLIAMRPDASLAPLLGLTPTDATLANAYLAVDTTTAPGAGIVGDTIQFHGTADRYGLAGATAVATLYSTANASTGDPAVTLRAVGPNGGMAAAFTFDLARSIVYTRQGNPIWAGQERDGTTPKRSSDLFFGAAAGDPQADWVDLNKVAIPQADEQQRLLANLVTHMMAGSLPMPRFWYFPRGVKAVVVMTGDDHANGGTAGRFEQHKAYSPAGCSVEDWECVRSTSYIFPNTPITNAEAAAYAAEGFEIGVHVNTGCADWTPEGLQGFYETQLAFFGAAFPGLAPPRTNRTHCVVWSDWATQASVELANGIRLDTNYYYWPGQWVANRPGFFTGSGMPMRFVDRDGRQIDVFQAATQMTDESAQSYPATANALLDNALGPAGFYGVFTANMHTDQASLPIADEIVLSAIARGVPIVSAEQMLDWLDARNASSFQEMTWTGSRFSFSIAAGAGARNLQAMVPASHGSLRLSAVTSAAGSVPFTLESIKGVEYAFFTAATGSYEAVYSEPPTMGVSEAAGLRRRR
jgi:hypothetical protein